MSIAVKTDTGWQVLGGGESSGGGATKWGGVTAAPNARKNSYGPDSQGRSWDCYVWDQGPSLGDSSPGIEFPVTLSGGMYRVLVVSGGAHGNFSGGAMKNNGGRITQGVFELPAGEYVARVGGLFRWGISSTNKEYRESFLKHVDTGVGVFSGIVSLAGDDNNSSGSFQGWRGNKDDGYLSDIEGQTWEYGANKNPDGVSISSYGAYSSSGAVIIATVDEDKTDYYPPGALPGVGGWATITSVWDGSGAKPNRYTYGDWVLFEWTADGSVKVTKGLVEHLTVGAGSWNGPGTGNIGSGASAQEGIIDLESDTYTLDVGQLVGDAQPAGPSHIISSSGKLVAGAVGGKNGVGGSQYPTPQSGFISAITGTDVEYGNSVNGTQFGDGKAGSPPAKGGAVLLRVPAAQAAGVDPSEYVDVP